MTFVEVRKDGDAGVDGLGGVDAVTVSPDGKHLYTAGPGENSVAVFSRASTTGELAFVEFEKDDVGGVDGLNGATSVTVSPDGKHVYVASFENMAAVFSRNQSTSKLTFVESEKEGVGGVSGLSSDVSVKVSPDWNHVYITSWEGAMPVFSRN